MIAGLNNSLLQLWEWKKLNLTGHIDFVFLFSMLGKLWQLKTGKIRDDAYVNLRNNFCCKANKVLGRKIESFRFFSWSMAKLENHAHPSMTCYQCQTDYECNYFQGNEVLDDNAARGLFLSVVQISRIEAVRESESIARKEPWGHGVLSSCLHITSGWISQYLHSLLCNSL